jgi:polyhydroxybutyrate depolymerase
LVEKFVLKSGVLACLVALSCSSAPGSTGGSGGAAGGAGGGGTGGSAGSGGSPGGGTGGGSNDAAATDTPGGAAGSGGAGGTGGALDASVTDRGGSASDGSGKGRTGMKSVGCGKMPMGANSTGFTNHRFPLTPCAACTVPNCPNECIAPPFAPGGRNAQRSGNGETFVDRDFAIQLPANYDPTHAYPVFYGGSGCGTAAVPPQRGSGFEVPGEAVAIRVGLQQVVSDPFSCFADGAIRCSPNIANVADCKNGPEIPYFRAVQKWVEENTCVDLGMEFVGGSSSGAWEALLAGCASADTVRGTFSVAGGLRENRWACNGPSAAFMIVSTPDQANPVGPLPMINRAEDTFGAAPARDELLTRNGCVGKTTAPYDPKYPRCVKYTGCPAAYPVVWCEFPNGNHTQTNYENVNYANAIVPFLLGLPPP